MVALEQIILRSGAAFTLFLRELTVIYQLWVTGSGVVGTLGDLAPVQGAETWVLVGPVNVLVHNEMITLQHTSIVS